MVTPESHAMAEAVAIMTGAMEVQTTAKDMARPAPAGAAAMAVPTVAMYLGRTSPVPLP